MSQTPLEAAEALRIGTVEYVAANEIKVILDIEAPDSIALNTGEPRPFPRVIATSSSQLTKHIW